MPYASRLDSTQAEVVAALRAAGWTVIPMNRMRGQFLDLLVAKQGVTIAVEVKTPGGRLTESEKKFFDEWQGLTLLVDSGQEAVDTCNAMFSDYAPRIFS